MKKFFDQPTSKGLIAALVVIVITGIALAVWVYLPHGKNESQNNTSAESKSESLRAYSVPDIKDDDKIIFTESKDNSSKAQSKSSNESSTSIDVYGENFSAAPSTSTPPKDDKKNTSSAPTVNDNKTDPSKKPDTTPSKPSNSTPPANNNNKGGDPTSPFYKGGDNPFDNGQTTSVDDSPADETSGKAGEGHKF